jgi:hypothetical protein
MQNIKTLSKGDVLLEARMLGWECPAPAENRRIVIVVKAGPRFAYAVCPAARFIQCKFERVYADKNSIMSVEDKPRACALMRSKYCQ